MAVSLALLRNKQQSKPAMESPKTTGSKIILNLKHYLQSGEHSDLTITCSDQDFNVHKIIFGLSSPVYHQLLSGNFKEAAENHSKITLHNEAEPFHALVHYIYNFTYDDSFISAPNTPMMFAVKIYAIADQYDVPELQSLAALKLKKICIPNELNVAEFIETMKLIDECTNEKDATLWDIVLPTIKQNMGPLLRVPEFQQYVFENSALNLKLLSMLGWTEESGAGDSDAEEQGAVPSVPTSWPFSGRRLGPGPGVFHMGDF